MSESEAASEHRCVTCGINVTATNAASFGCPSCGHALHRCAKCRKQSNQYNCPECGFRGP